MSEDHDIMLSQVMSMGFELEESQTALEITGFKSAEEAISYLLDKKTSSSAPQASSEVLPIETPKEPKPRKSKKDRTSRKKTKRKLVASEYEEEIGYDAIDAAFEEEEFQRENFKVVGLECDLSSVINKDNIHLVLAEEVNKVSDICEVNFTAAGALLKHLKWDSQRLLELFFDNPKKLLRSVGVKSRDDEASSVVQKFDKGAECSICMNSLEPGKARALACKHAFCNSCWKDHIEVQINEGRSIDIPCMGYKCNAVVDEETVRLTVSPEIYQKYTRFLSKNFVEDNPYLKWCPSPSCGNVVRSESLKAKIVVCSCGFKFCFVCCEEAHLPAGCAMMKEWTQKCKDDSETFNWLSANTKDCPKCNSSIEKNGGCNHMTCRKCAYEFCWICFGNWKTHSACNKYDEAESKAQSGRAALGRYLHYWTRYNLHEQSKKFESKLREKALQAMVNLREQKKNYQIDVKFIERATEQLIECRRTLKYTYVSAFYMDSGPEKTLFEYLQADLEKTTEDLSGMLEAAGTPDRRKLSDMSLLAGKKLQHLLDGVEEGLTSSFAPSSTQSSKKIYF
eukprot:TRINITY_DN1960_c0_g2_i1.p1 TRINITY_DN1960_c0_g2~~TRINITY_DN1960_c0_g2_i1.p1  ORF type:complete len:581 (+),score=118.51 TRINITY_DN1960_c0_g2_i1:48-1745(+)